MLGSVLAWGLIGPVLVKYGAAAGAPNVDPDDPEYWKWSEFMGYTSMAGLDGKSTPSPRYWLLWPGVMMMLCASMVELVIQYKVIWYGLKIAGHNFSSAVNGFLQKRGRTVGFFARQANKDVRASADQVEDPALPHEQVPTWLWSSGLLGVVALTLAICDRLWDMHPGYTVLGLLMGFLFSFLAIHVGGVTDTTPLTAAAKSSQLVMGGATSHNGFDVTHNQKINLVAGVIASGGASVASDLVSGMSMFPLNPDEPRGIFPSPPECKANTSPPPFQTSAPASCSAPRP